MSLSIYTYQAVRALYRMRALGADEALRFIGFMSRAARLLDLLQALRKRRAPVSAAVLAEELGVSLRTVYRDIATLTAQGADIAGEAGVGYVMRAGFVLPPLMFRDEEIEALVLGLRFVAQRGDDSLASAAEDAAAKILAVLPASLADAARRSRLLVPPAEAERGARSAKRRADGKLSDPTVPPNVSIIREALRKERKLRLEYQDLMGADSNRIVWPVALGYFDSALMLAAWCELRQGFRHFRADGIRSATLLEERPPRGQAALFDEWKAKEGVGHALT